jgi:UDP-2,3-diacylglucosamine hydrolase
MFIISDSHIDATTAPRFFDMLSRLTTHPEAVVFLGDIFELWIALPGYEEPHHQRLLDWVDARRAQGLEVGWIDGNHEFYIIERYGDRFSWATDRVHREEGCSLAHGDLVNRNDHNYLRFRRLIRSGGSRFVMRLLGQLGIGARLATRLKQSLKHTNTDFRKTLPTAELAAYAAQEFSTGARRVIVGHFHDHFRHTGTEGRVLQVAPAWERDESILRIKEGEIQTASWETLLPAE